MAKSKVKAGDMVHVRGMVGEFAVVKVTDVRGDSGERYIILRERDTLFTVSDLDIEQPEVVK